MIKKCGESSDIKLIGTVTVGPKGQIVLPKDVRATMNIQPGDSLAVILKQDRYIGVVKNDDISEIINYISNK